MAFAKRLQRTLKVMVVTSTDTNTPRISLCKKMGNATTYTNKKMDSLQRLQSWLFSKCQDEGPYPLSGQARDQVPTLSRPRTISSQCQSQGQYMSPQCQSQGQCPLNVNAKVNTCPLNVKAKEHVPSIPSQGTCPLDANAKDHVTSVSRRRTTTGPTTGN